MSTKQTKETNVVSVEVMQRNDEVTLSTSLGGVISVQSNQRVMAIGLVVAEALKNACSRASLRSAKFDAKIEITMY